MYRSQLTGTRIRARRNMRGMRQADLARSVGVSPSFLNLIEHNRRKVSPALLEAIAEALAIPADALTEEADSRLTEGVRAAALRTAADLAEMDRIEEFTGRFPGWAQVLAETQSRVERLERVVEQLSDRMTHDPQLREALHAIISAVTSVQSTAAILNDAEGVDADWQVRFHENILEDSGRLAEGAVALVNYLDAANSEDMGRAAPQEEVEAWLAQRDFHVAELDAGTPVDIERMVVGQVELSASASRSLARDWMRRFAADAHRLPMEPFLDALVEEGPAPDRLAARFDAPFDAVLRRMAMLPPEDPRARTMPQPGLVVCDMSGTLVFRRSIEGFALPRFGGGCPLWPLYQALRQPLQPLRVTMMTAGRMGRRFVGYGYAAPLGSARFDMPAAMQATMLVLPAEPEPEPARPLPVGASCRTCAQAECPARREPSILMAAE